MTSGEGYLLAGATIVCIAASGALAYYGYRAYHDTRLRSMATLSVGMSLIAVALAGRSLLDVLTAVSFRSVVTGERVLTAVGLALVVDSLFVD